jgi:pyruvate dehydrogenase E2 component (dihydrolipoamide acetyltransferase)
VTIQANIDVLMPALSSTMTEGKIVSWLKSVGDKVEAGDALMVVESDKADMDVESYDEGYLAAILTEEGNAAKVGATVAVIVGTEAELASFASGAAPSAQAAQSAPAAQAAAAPVPQEPAPLAASAVPARGGVPVIETKMPALSSTMTEGKIVSWLKSVGDKVEAGDALMVVESDKADMDVESYDEGYLAAIFTDEGNSAPVGATVALLVSCAADIEAAAGQGARAAGGNSAPAAGRPAATAAAQHPAASVAVVSAPIINEGRVVASGYAKKLAGDRGVDLRTVLGSGPGGRITGADVEVSPTGGGAMHVPAPGVIAATPMARKLAKSKKVQLSSVKGTGNFARITEDDVLIHLGMPPKKAPISSSTHVAATPATSTATVKAAVPTKAPATSPATAVLVGSVPMDGMKKAVAKNMEASLTVPVFRVSRGIVTDKFDELYAVSSVYCKRFVCPQV